MLAPVTCPHSSQPGPCSSCLGAVPRVVVLSGGVTYLDGVPVSRLGADGMTAAEMPQPRAFKHRYGRRRK